MAVARRIARWFVRRELADYRRQIDTLHRRSARLERQLEVEMGKQVRLRREAELKARKANDRAKHWEKQARNCKQQLEARHGRKGEDQQAADC